MPTEFNTSPRKQRWRNRPSRWATAAACGALLAACQHTAPPEATPPMVHAAGPVDAATPPPPPPVAVPVSDATAVETDEVALSKLLRYAAQLRTMSPAEFKRELNKLGNLVPRTGAGAAPSTNANASPKVQMQLALALLQTREPVETARALGLLQRIATSTEPDAKAYMALAQVLTDNLIATRRLEDNLERTSQQLRESQRRIEALNERLNAMRAIERSMSAPQPSPVRPAHP